MTRPTTGWESGFSNAKGWTGLAPPHSVVPRVGQGPVGCTAHQIQPVFSHRLSCLSLCHQLPLGVAVTLFFWCPKVKQGPFSYSKPAQWAAWNSVVFTENRLLVPKLWARRRRAEDSHVLEVFWMSAMVVTASAQVILGLSKALLGPSYKHSLTEASRRPRR